ncbi:MAG: nucleotide sugar dehydrogenase [Bacteroidota bacterium]|nr:nucleotide sugar dehydrogenase [Bacteroidota bacterium]MDP4233043.1 nucleotide sugar dehydrogenase [Bacteroidota bacterium]MDP4241812.1 nucleotide sugar dehydrogenase [Bacteroidota bacterium]MDP4288767.1 nucleotide sugar dehydrogenase [Bacteroidota bacterium]
MEIAANKIKGTKTVAEATTNGSAIHGTPAAELERKLRDKTAKIGVIGLGYVGLPLAVEFSVKGFETVGIDLDPNKIDSLTAGKNYIQDLRDEVVEGCLKNGKLRAQRHYDGVSSLDVLYICVPTPFTTNKDPDITYIVSAAESLATQLRDGQLIILKSTTFPNTTEGIVLPILEATGKKVGQDFFLAFSPERIDPGNQKFTTANTPIVVGGVTPECTRLAVLTNQQIIAQVIAVSGPKVAEMEKLLENIFRSVNIALVNELARLCDRMGGINMWEVVDAAATKPFGYMPFYPGPGIGGHCILIDPYYLAWQARAHDFETNFITLAAETNESMPFYVKDLVFRAVADLPVRLRDAKVLMLGVAFKRDVDDTRHSPAIRVMEILMDEGVNNIAYCDPFVPNLWVKGSDFAAQELTKESLEAADVVVITTDHTSYDYEFIVKHSAVVIDTRNATKHISDPILRSKIVLLGSGHRAPSNTH